MGVELIHTATLVHDDINDHGTLRRGRETVNARWGGTIALLTGDFMFTKVYQLMARYTGAINAILAKATATLVEGETLQILASKSGTLDRETYMEIIAKKTAALFVAAVDLGASIADAPAEWIAALKEYAFNLGLAFQIADDILDLVGDAQTIGKNAGIDIAQGRGLAVAMQGHAGALPGNVTIEAPDGDLPFGMDGFGDPSRRRSRRAARRHASSRSGPRRASTSCRPPRPRGIARAGVAGRGAGPLTQAPHVPPRAGGLPLRLTPLPARAKLPRHEL